MFLAPGARLGPYEILAPLGSGGMGEVYCCRDTRVPRAVVALKVLAPPVAQDTDFRRRFSREAQIIAGLNHPHICALYDIGNEHDTPFIVMPMLDGQSLADRMREAAIPVAEALRIVIAVASAIAYAHGQGVLHRDVKPRNIMLGADGSVKLLDFGIARYMEPLPSGGTTIETLTQSARLLGTLEYMSPEQLSGQHLDGRSDLFSLAVVAYELFAGRHPFRGEARVLTANAILECNYPSIASGDPLIQAADVVLKKALSREPHHRYASMTDFMKELEFLQKVNQSPGHAERPHFWTHRKIAGAFAGIAAVLALAATLLTGIGRGNAETGDARPESPPVSGETIVKGRPPGSAPTLRATYNRVGSPLAIPSGVNFSELGVTVWRLRPAMPNDRIRLLVHETGPTREQWTPERVDLGTPLAVGERVRISVESPRDGYLYVIDRERYADGSTGIPHMIFPTLQTRSGDNRLSAGRLIDIPSQTDRPPYFTLQASRSDQTAELLTMIVSVHPLPELLPAEQALKVPPDLVEHWEQRGALQQIEQFELVGGPGRAWSSEEQLAGADATRLLTQDAPPPQTVFRIVTSEPKVLVTEVTLKYR